jgi:D-glycero-D-manno-heptose 1,7-bisphosphate phosphatase
MAMSGPFMERRPGLFIDKDGTLIEDVPYNVDPERVQLAPGSTQALQRFHTAGYALVVVSNQSGVALGYFAEARLGAVEQRLRDLLREHGLPLDGFYYCPHASEATVPAYAVRCDCRKPAPGLLLRAARDLDLDLTRSWMVGDILDDVEAGRQAGCRTVLIDNGHETEWHLTSTRIPDYAASNLQEAAACILMPREQ